MQRIRAGCCFEPENSDFADFRGFFLISQSRGWVLWGEADEGGVHLTRTMRIGGPEKSRWSPQKAFATKSALKNHVREATLLKAKRTWLVGIPSVLGGPC
jgi:hypothetical protein